MNKQEFSRPIDLKNVSITDGFWKDETELVRKEVIPYQWRALNDMVEGASPSFCMRNFKLAGKITKERKNPGYKEIIWPVDNWETLPENKEKEENRFYGWVFQDSDFFKWIEAVAYSLTMHPDDRLEKVADEAIDVVCAAQQDNGYLDTYYIINDMSKVFTNLRDKHELYCFGHLAEGAVAYYKATGKDKLLNAAKKYADYIASCFGKEDGKKKGYPGHEIAEMALSKLYEVTDDKKYLELAKFFIDERGKRPYYFDLEEPGRVKKGEEENERYEYNQAHKPVREQETATGHAVRAVYLYSGMADVARNTMDESLYDACERLWTDITTRQMYITGGIGSTHLGEAFSFDYDLPNDTAYAETCAAIGLVFFSQRMLSIKPDSKYADVIERALYNGILSGMALDGKSFFYVNPLETDPFADRKDARKWHVSPSRRKWFGCACCPPNIARLLSSIAGYAYSENETTLFVNLYMGSTVNKTFKDKTVSFEITGGMPFSGDVHIKCISKESVYGTVAFRIPDWSGSVPSFEKIFPDAEIMRKEGYAYITRMWNNGEEFSFEFEMAIRIMKCNDNVRENAMKAAVCRGPLVYCLEEKDNGKKLWKYRLDPLSEGHTENIRDIPVKNIKAIRMDGYKQSDNSDVLYYEYKKEQCEKTELLFIPYFCWNNRGEGEMSVWVNVK